MISRTQSDFLTFLAEATGSVVCRESAACDIRFVLKDLISLHNSTFPDREGIDTPKFNSPPDTVSHLYDLLAPDFETINSRIPAVGREQGYVDIAEIAEPIPNAQAEHSERAILVHTPLVAYLNSFFAKAHILLSDETGAGCVPAHDAAMTSKDYSDVSLVEGMFADLHKYFVEGLLEEPMSPAYLGDPYDLCERVEGARHFMLLHELGHIAFRNSMFAGTALHISEPARLAEITNVANAALDAWLQVLTEFKNDSESTSWSPMSLNSFAGIETLTSSELQHVHSIWREEFIADSFATIALISELDFNTTSGPGCYETMNFFAGVFLLFQMFRVKEVALASQLQDWTSHPPAVLRLRNVMCLINATGIFEGNPSLRAFCNNSLAPVSYTHLTLPTIYSV